MKYIYYGIVKELDALSQSMYINSLHLFQLILMSVLNCLYDSVSQILRKNVEKRAVLDSLDIVMLAMDEICDGG